MEGSDKKSDYEGYAYNRPKNDPPILAETKLKRFDLNIEPQKLETFE